MDSIKRYLLPLLVLGSLVSLAVEFQSFFLTNFIEPIAILCWAVWRIVSSVNQNIYWMILILVCTSLVIRLVPPEKHDLLHPPSNYRHKSPGRVEYWQTLISDAILEDDKTAYLRDNLKQLFLSAFAKLKQSHPMDVEEIIAAGKIPLSSKARHFLFPSKKKGGIISIPHHLGIQSLIPRRLRRWAGKFILKDTAAISEILEYLESEMELGHDR